MNHILFLLVFMCVSCYVQSQWVEKKFVDQNFNDADSSRASYVLRIERKDPYDDNGIVETYDKIGYLLNSTAYSSITQEIKDGKFLLYYANSSQLRSQQTYENNIEHGPFIYYYNDGSIQAKGFKKNGVLSDTLQSFYPDGTIKRLEFYGNGTLSGGDCFDSTGHVQPHVTFESEAEFPGGIQNLMAFIQSNLVYPSDAIELNISGKVLVRFVVDSLGVVKDIKIQKGVYYSIDQEVMRVVKLMPNWIPGTFDGDPINSLFRLPVNFELNNEISSLSCLDSTTRRKNVYWKTNDLVLTDAYTGETMKSIARRNKAYYRLFLLNTKNGKIRRKTVEFSRLEYIQEYKFSSKRHAKRFREFCM